MTGFSEAQTFVAQNGDRLQIVPQRGGLVTGWLCHGPWGLREILYFDAERFADPSKSVRGGIPVLFPICGGLPGSALPQHGFARDMPWRMAELADGSGVRLSLDDTAETRALFPHAFRLELEYRLQPQALEITARVTNPAAEGALPFSLGLHPYFTVADLASARLSGLPGVMVDQAAPGGSPGGTTLPTADALAGLPGGVDLLGGPTTAVRLDSGDLAITLETRAPMDLTVIWTDPPRPMVCVEPWTAPRGALTSGERLLQVPAGGSLELGCRYRVDPSAA